MGLRITSPVCFSLALLLFACSVGLAGCKDEPDLPPVQQEKSFELGKQTSNLIGEKVLDLPDDDLVTQATEKFEFDTVKGRPHFFTFIYTRCPMDDMCPLLTRKTAAVQKVVSRYRDRFRKMPRVLIFTFDPEYDTPEVLKKYGKKRGIDYATADFVTGKPETIEKVVDFFNLAVKQTEKKDLYNHNMRSFVIDHTGTIRHAFSNSKWSSNRAARRLIEVARSPDDSEQ